MTENTEPAFSGYEETKLDINDEPRLTGKLKVGVTTFNIGVKLSTVQGCIDSYLKFLLLDNDIKND